MDEQDHDEYDADEGDDGVDSDVHVVIDDVANVTEVELLI